MVGGLSGRTPSFLGDKDLELIFFGGKGGVGKTTCAAATALQMAKQGRKTLIMSIDPAHSLSDSFECEVGKNITKIDDNLYALEIDTEELIEEYKKKNEMYIKTIVDRGTYLDAQDLDNFFELSMPGMDEIMAMRKLGDFMKEENTYDVFIIDTAATGHMMRFLSLPKFMGDFAEILGIMQAKYRYIKSTFTRRKSGKDEMDRFLEEQIKDVRNIRSLLSDDVKTEFVLVTIPESMGVEETRIFLESIKKYKINIKNIVLNMLYTHDGCDFCSSKKKDQEKYIEQIHTLFSDYKVIDIPLFPYEIKGIQSLQELGEVLAGNAHEWNVTKQPATKILPKILSIMSGHKKSSKPEVPEIKDLGERKLLLFGGKGGLGKTTVAAATALELAKALPKKKILIFSTDPAQALGRSFAIPIGIEPTQIKTNLYAVAMDADAALTEFKQTYGTEIDEIFGGFVGGGAGMDLPFDRKIFNRMLDLSPPGLDELMALSKIMDLMEQEKYDIFILDTAPSGHLLRLLELPDVVMDWFSAMIKTMKRYRKVVSFYKSMKLVLTKKKLVKDLIALLKDETKTEFVIVTIPEDMGIVETERLLKRLSELKIPTHRIVINRVTPRSRCDFCSSKREKEQKYVEQTYERFPEYAIGEVPLLPHEVVGVDSLTNFADVMYRGVM